MGNQSTSSTNKNHPTLEIKDGKMIFIEDSLGNKRASKSYNINCNDCFTKDERDFLTIMRHKNILPPREFVEKSDRYYAVYDYFCGDNLEEYLKKKEKLSDQEAYYIIQSIIDAVAFLYKKGLCHGNIKPQNIMIKEGDRITIKLTDFLIKDKISWKNEKYCAPENNSHSSMPSIMKDIWSIGKTMKFITKYAKPRNELCNNLISQCLKKSIEKRIKFNEILKHPYITSTIPTKKFFVDDLYICTCSVNASIMLKCGDSFCTGCFSILPWKSKLSSRKESFKVLSKNKAILCPNCLSYSKILYIKLHCGCILKPKLNLGDYISTSILLKNNGELYCLKHKVKIESMEQYIISNNVEIRVTDIDIENANAKTVAKALTIDNSLNPIHLICCSFSSTCKILKMLEISNSISSIDIPSDYIFGGDIKAIAEALKFSRSVNEISLKYYSISNNDIMDIAKALKINNSLNSICLWSNYACDKGAKALAEAIKTNDSLNKIDLRLSSVQVEGVKAIAEAIEFNNSLDSIRLWSNYIVDDGAISMAMALRNNCSIKSIHLWSSNINDEGAKAIADALEFNISLRVIDLNSNHIGGEGAKAMAETLKKNRSLEKINLNSNKICAEGAKAIAEALKSNCLLKVVCLGSNNICVEGAKAIAKLIEFNTSLIKIELYSNNIGNEGADAIAVALKSNCVLNTIDLNTNHIGLEGAVAIADALKNNNSLSKIALWSNYIDKEFHEELKIDKRVMIW